jgi:hypothetical protein
MDGRYQILNPNIEIRNKFKIQITKRSKLIATKASAVAKGYGGQAEKISYKNDLAGNGV